MINWGYKNLRYCPKNLESSLYLKATKFLRKGDPQICWSLVFPKIQERSSINPFTGPKNLFNRKFTACSHQIFVCNGYIHFLQLPIVLLHSRYCFCLHTSFYN